MYLFVQIRLFSGSHAVFKNNSAKNGGGISIYTPVIYKDVDVSSFYNMLCFIQYDTLITDGLAPKNWNVRMYTLPCCLYYSYITYQPVILSIVLYR